MADRGDIVVERLTGKRAIVIHVVGPEEVTCRFGDGRLEDRFTFELETPQPFLGSLLAAALAPFLGYPRVNPAPAVGSRVRPLILRQPTAQ